MTLVQVGPAREPRGTLGAVARTDTFDLGRLGLSSGEGRRLDLVVGVESFQFGGQRYEVPAHEVSAMLDVAHTTSGYSLRLRFEAELDGPCMRCLEPADQTLAVDAREVDQPGGGEELDSPYLEADELDVKGWARDALALALPAQIVCRDECAGLCPQCGQNLNDHPHEHEPDPDPRWAKLRELRLDG
jgi:uncharacterized protein